MDLMSRLYSAGLLVLGVLVACGGTTSRHEPDASPPSTSAGTDSRPTPAGGGTNEAGAPVGSGGTAEAGAAPTMTNGGDVTSSGGASGGGGMGAAAAGGSGGGGAGPVHDRCADPLPLEIVNGEAIVSDNTSRATDEFPTLTCVGAAAQGFPGGQLYYRFTARPGREYALGIEAAGFATVGFYVFPADAACSEEAIRAACSSDGVTGTRSTNVSATALTRFAPREPGDYIIGVDTSYPKGAAFTLSLFEYCGTSGATDCKTKGCDIDVWRTCLGNTLSFCNADGTATVNTDCTLENKSCRTGFCVESVNDSIGNTWTTSPAMTAGEAGVTLLDFYEVTTSRTLTKVEMIMVQPRVFALEWRILEAMDRAGPYQTIFATTTMSGGAAMASSETPGPLQVPMVAGRFYAIGVALPAEANYYLQQQGEKSLPLDVYFGQLTSAAVVPSASGSTTISYPAPSDFVVAQRLITKLR